MCVYILQFSIYSIAFYAGTYSSGFVKEKPSKASGSIAPITASSTGDSATFSLVNSASKLLYDFLLFYKKRQ